MREEDDEEADALFALSVIEAAEPVQVVVPPGHEGYFDRLLAIRKLAAAHERLLAQRRFHVIRLEAGL